MRALIEGVRPLRVEGVLPELTKEIAALRQHSDAAPWYIQLPLGVGMFVASALTCAGLGVVANDEFLIGSMGLFLAMVSSIASWFPLPWAARPLVLVSVLLARLMIGFGVGYEALAFPLVALELVLLLVHRDPLNRLIAATSAPLWLAWGLDWQLNELLELVALGVGGSLVVSRALWAGFTPLRSLLYSVAMGALAFALIAPCLQSDPWSGVASIGIGLAGAVAAVVIASSLGLPVPERVLTGIFPLGVALLTVPVPGVQAALVVALLGFVSRSWALWALSVAAMAAYGAYFMYDLDFGLWAKGGAMIGAGTALVLMGLLAGRYRD